MMIAVAVFMRRLVETFLLKLFCEADAVDNSETAEPEDRAEQGML